jgi:hypothetical protein
MDAKHPKVRESLQNGWAYVWCTIHPADHGVRERMQAAANKLASKLNVDPGLFEFRWPEQIQGEVDLHTNIIASHLPHLAAILGKMLTLAQWSKEPGMDRGWVDFGQREMVVQRVVTHLLGRDRPNVLHIAGLSGIGKTRSVLEACRRDPELSGVLYLQTVEDVTTPLYSYLEEHGRHAYIVIDGAP